MLLFELAETRKQVTLEPSSAVFRSAMDTHVFYLVILVVVILAVVSQHTGSKVIRGCRNHTHYRPRVPRESQRMHHKGPKHGHQVDKEHGVINRNACSLCEPLVGQLVCGTDGNTYMTLCHAVHCAGLTEKQVKMGACTEMGVCEQAKCKKKICVPKLAQCVPWKDSSRKSIPCKSHHCERKCVDGEDVCGMDRQTYSSLCSLYEAGTLLAYEGACTPRKCQSKVCGTDGKTYHSSCHAKAQGARVHYTGECFSDHQLDYEYKQGFVCNLIETRCKNVTCIEPFLPPDSCCRMCGGGLLLKQKKATTENMRKIIKEFHYNSILTIRNAIIDLLPAKIEESCDFSVTLTNNGYITVLLESILHHKSLFCAAVSKELSETISNPPSGLEPPTSLLMKLYEVQEPNFASTQPGLPTPAMFFGFDPLGDLQDTTYDLKNQAENEASNAYGGGVNEVDSHLSNAEDKAYDNSAMITKFSGIVTIINLIILIIII